MNRNYTCNNCNKTGHLFHQCRLPITSYGIIVYRMNQPKTEIEFLMIRRKDSFGYIDFIRGKYQMHSPAKVQQLINEMSAGEKLRLTTSSFTTMWQQLWGDKNARSDEMSAMRKFDSLVRGDDSVSLLDLIQNSTTNWEETEWEFPKGRRNSYEKDVDCALREFEEETGYSRDDICIIENVSPYEEIFIGSNNKSYKHKYFLAVLKDDNEINLQNYQKSEVSKLEWKTIDECLKSIRPYNLEKKQLIININKVLQEYRLY